MSFGGDEKKGLLGLLIDNLSGVFWNPGEYRF
jgi:hypothetical protein